MVLFFQTVVSNMRLCDLCFAQKPTNRADPAMNYMNMAEAPIYELAGIDHITYMATTPQVSPWNLVEGWTLHTCVYDLMYNLFLGCGRDFVASSLRVLLEKGYFDGLWHERECNEMFSKITLLIQEAFRNHKSFVMVKKERFPSMFGCFPLSG